MRDILEKDQKIILRQKTIGEFTRYAFCYQ